MYVDNPHVISSYRSLITNYEWDRYAEGSENYGSWDAYEADEDNAIDKAIASLTEDYKDFVDQIVSHNFYSIPWRYVDVTLKDGTLIKICRNVSDMGKEDGFDE
jgi:hypothetical protein